MSDATPTPDSAPSWAPGFYDDGSGRQRWWDGAQWTDHYQDTAVPQMPVATASAAATAVPPVPAALPVRKPGRKVPLVALVLTGVGGLVLGLIIGVPSGAGSHPGGTAIDAPRSTVVTTPGPTVTVLVTPPPVVPAGPKTSFEDGTYLVNTDIAPGTYKTAGTSGSNCYYERDKDASGTLDSIISNDNTTGQAVVTIAPTDGVFKSNGCQTWTKVG